VFVIDRADLTVREWVGKVLPDVIVSHAPPDEPPDGLQVHAVLVGLDRAHARLGPARDPTPVTVTARYLISVASADDAQAHGALGELVFAALEDDLFEVDFDRVEELWRSLGSTLRPGFVLCVPVERRRAVPAVPLARKTQMRFEAARPMAGVILGPDETPLADVSVAIDSLGVTTRTDHAGRFSFACLPPTLDAGDLVVLAKGRECRATAIEAPPGEPLVVRVNGLET
jgi:hypothetical protein